MSSLLACNSLDTLVSLAVKELSLISSGLSSLLAVACAICNRMRDVASRLTHNSPSWILAAAFKSKIDRLMGELTLRITEEDSYTTEADVRYFESN